MCQYRYLCYSTCTHRVVELVELCRFVEYNAALTPGVDVTPCFETIYKSHSRGTTIPGTYWQLFQGFCHRCLGSGGKASKKEQGLDQYLDMGIYQPVLPPVEEYVVKIHLDGSQIFPNNKHPFMKIAAFEISWFKMLSIEDRASDVEKSGDPMFSFRGKFDMYQPDDPDGQWKFKFAVPLIDKKPLQRHYIFKNGGLTRHDRDHVINAVSCKTPLWEVYRLGFAVRGMTYDHFLLYAVDKWEVPMAPDDGSNAAVAYKMNCDLRCMLNLAPLEITPSAANMKLLRFLRAEEASQQEAQASMFGPAAPPYSAPNTQHPEASYQDHYDAQMMQAPLQNNTYQGPCAGSQQPVLQQPYVSSYGPSPGVMQPQMFYNSQYPPLVAAPQAMYPSASSQDMQMGVLQENDFQHQHPNTPNLHSPLAAWHSSPQVPEGSQFDSNVLEFPNHAPPAVWNNSAPQAPEGSQFASNSLEFQNQLSGTRAPNAEFLPRFSSFAQQEPPSPRYVSQYSQNSPQAVASGCSQAGFPHPTRTPSLNFEQQLHNMAPRKRHYDHEELYLQSSFDPAPSAKRQRLDGSSLGMGGPDPEYAYTNPPEQFTLGSPAHLYPDLHPQELPKEKEPKWRY